LETVIQLVIERFLMCSAFSTITPPEDLTLVRDTAERLLDALIAGDGDAQDVYGYVKAFSIASLSAGLTKSKLTCTNSLPERRPLSPCPTIRSYRSNKGSDIPS